MTYIEPRVLAEAMGDYAAAGAVEPIPISIPTPPLWKILVGMMALGLVIFSFGACAT